MANPVSKRPTHKRYLGNTHKMGVHDLGNEKLVCQIDKIIRAGHAVVFEPDTLEEAQREGYNNCGYCSGGSVG